MNIDKLVVELKKTRKKEYIDLAKRLKANAVKKDPAEAKRIRRECTIALVNELDAYQNDELINQLLIFVGKEIKSEEKANRK